MDENPYRAPDAGSAATGRFISIACLATVNSLAALGSFWFVPLARHIYSCREGQKWCHMQAFVVGVPSALVWFVLVGITTALTIGAAPRRVKPLKIVAWLGLAIALCVLVALFAAVAHNS